MNVKDRGAGYNVVNDNIFFVFFLGDVYVFVADQQCLSVMFCWILMFLLE